MKHRLQDKINSQNVAYIIQQSSSFRFGSDYDQCELGLSHMVASKQKLEHDLASQSLDQQLIIINYTTHELNYGFVSTSYLHICPCLQLPFMI